MPVTKRWSWLRALSMRMTSFLACPTAMTPRCRSAATCSPWDSASCFPSPGRLLADPSILILDEATASIDTETELKIQEALKTLLAGRTSFIIAHRLSTIRHCDNIVVLDHGRIVEQGNHDELMRHGGTYYGLIDAQYRFLSA